MLRRLRWGDASLHCRQWAEELLCPVCYNWWEGGVEWPDEPHSRTSRSAASSHVPCGLAQLQVPAAPRMVGTLHCRPPHYTTASTLYCSI